MSKRERQPTELPQAIETLKKGVEQLTSARDLPVNPTISQDLADDMETALKKVCHATESSNDFWAVFFLNMDPVVSVTFVPAKEFDISFDGNVWDQTDAAMRKLDDRYEEFLTLDLVTDAKKVAEMFRMHKCIPISHGCD